MFSKMSVIAFTAGLVATLCVTDVNAVVYETCTFTDDKCTAEVEGSCLGGINQPDQNADYYAANQAGDDIDGIGMGEYKTCKKYAKAYWKVLESKGGTGDMTEEAFMAQLETVSNCRENEDAPGTYLGMRCGASFTSSSMAALFGLLCVSLALW